MHEQTIWLAPRATGFTEVCEACEDEHPEIVGHGTVRGTLRLDVEAGWASCPRGHSVRVIRMSARMPAGAFR